MSRSTVLPEDSAPPWRGFFLRRPTSCVERTTLTLLTLADKVIPAVLLGYLSLIVMADVLLFVGRPLPDDEEGPSE